MSEDHQVVGLRPDRDIEAISEIFSILSDENRVELLLTLGDALEPKQFGRSFDFNDFWDEVRIEDSGQFNYHLDKLRGTFIEKSEDGYALTYSGVILYNIIRSGKLDANAGISSAETTSECSNCSSVLVASYENQLVTVECPDCGTRFMQIPVPPGCTATNSGDHLLHAAVQFAVQEAVTLCDGICPNCGGHADPEIVPADERNESVDNPTAHYQCTVCEYIFHLGISGSLLTHPALLSFCYRHDINPIGGGTPEDFLSVIDPDNVSVVSRDPWQLEYELQLDGESLRLLLDDELSVTVP